MSMRADAEASNDTVEAVLNYVAPDSHVNRRYVFPGDEVNTGRFVPHSVTVRDARHATPAPSLDTHGFQLFRHQSAIADFRDRAEIDRLYPAEVVAAVQRITGADLVLPSGYLLRTAAGDAAERMLQPPAADVHVDMAWHSAPRTARQTFDEQGPKGKAYRRFLCSSFWRAFSPPPQDWPLALCDSSSISQHNGEPNRLIFTGARPTDAEIAAALEHEDELPAATIFRYTPGQRWFYYPDMTRDEAIVIKFYDSDHGRAWFSPHTAFHDRSRPDAHTRESIEFRTVAYWF